MVQFSTFLETTTSNFRPFRTGYLAALVTAIFSCILFSQAASATNPPALTPGTVTSGTSAAYFSTNQQTVIMTADPSATIYYTTDGTTPTTSSTVYGGGTTGITVFNYTTVKAIASLSSVLSTVTTAYIQYEVPRSNLQLWLKPENMVVSSGSLTGWTDVSGNSTTVTQGTGANQPSVTANALYGYSSATFNGATTNSSYLTVASGSSLTPALFLDTITGGASIFAVINPNTSSAAKALFTSSATGVTDLIAFQTNASNITFNANNAATAGSITTSAGPMTTGKFHILDVVYAITPAATIDVDTVPAAATGTLKILRSVSRPVSYIGGNNALLTTAFWGGQLVELLAYSRNLTVTERALVQAYFATRYQLGNSLLTAMPIISVPTGTLAGPTPVAISADANATTFYTLDGTVPNPASSPVYSQPINIYYSQTLTALSVANGVSSATSSSVYTLDATKYPAPNGSDTTSLQINLQLPTTAIPQ